MSQQPRLLTATNFVVLYYDRCQWADYFDSQGVEYAFYSAANAAAIQEARREAAAARLAHVESANDSDEEDDEDVNSHLEPSDSVSDNEMSDSSSEFHHDDDYFSAEEDTPDGRDARAKVLSVVELEDWFEKMAPDLSGGQPF